MEINPENMSWMNYHSHCDYCDGKGRPEEYVKAAIQNGLISYGFSSHAPLPFHEPWSMALSDLYEYRNEIKGLKNRFFDQIQLYVGLEVDFIPEEITPKMQIIEELNLDYTIGSIHFVDRLDDGKHWEIDGQNSIFLQGMEQIFDNNIKRFCERYYELHRMMIEDATPDIVGHLDKFKIHNQENQWFDESEKWYQDLIMETLESIREQECILEVNTRGLYKNISSEPYPSYWILERCLDLGIPITLNSDCHRPEEITKHFKEVSEKLQLIGFNEFKVLYNGEWQDKPFDSQGVVTSKYA